MAMLRIFVLVLSLLLALTSCRPKEDDEVSSNTSTTTTTSTDSTAPVWTQLDLDNTGITESQTATLTLTGTDGVGITAYYLSETNSAPAASASGWTSLTSTTSLSTSVDFSLSSGGGTKTVYGWLKDEEGNVSDSSSDSITYAVWQGTRIFGSAGDDVCGGMTIGTNHHIYITCYSSGSWGSYSNAGNYDLVVVGYDPNGDRQLTIQKGYSGFDGGVEVALDTSANFYVAGATGNSYADTFQGGYDALLVKMDSTGSQLWAVQLGSTGDDVAEGLGLDSEGNPYLVVNAGGTLGGTTALGTKDIHLAKYNTSGTLQWSARIGESTKDTMADDATVDTSDNSFYLAGFTGGSVGGTSSGGDDGLVAKYNSTGTQQWIKQIGSSSYDRFFSIAVASSAIIVGGEAGGAIGSASNVGGKDAVLASISKSGTANWMVTFGSSSDDRIEAVEVDKDGNIYVAGYTYGTLDGTSAGGQDAFLAKYSSDGSRIWLSQFGSSSNDTAQSIAFDAMGNVFVSGITYGSIDRQSTLGSGDAFLVKYTSNGARK